MIKRHINYLVLFGFLAAFVFILFNLCYARNTVVSPVAQAPEPGSLALVSTGIIGWIIRYARKRFIEFKRVFDTIMAAIGLVLVSPVILLTAMVIKIVSPGPVFYKQERVGWGGKTFFIYKLRTMRLDAETTSGPVWAKKNDPRLIRFGRIIRKMHLDELPQFFNVLKGEMSIVGPRPERPVFVEKLSKDIPEYKRRINIRPGITGLAQVRHKYDETINDVRKKVKLDLMYMRKMCVMTDIRILLLTIIVSVLGKGAR